MGLAKFTTSFPWQRYSRKLRNRIEKPKNGGYFLREDADLRAMRLVVGVEGTKAEGNMLSLFWLVDPNNGIIVDAKFQVFGQSALVGAADVLCDLLVGKNYDQARRMSADLLDKELSDRSGKTAFPKETYPHINLAISAVDTAASFCVDIPLPTTYIAPPVPLAIGEVLEGGYPGFEEMKKEQKLALIEQVLDSEVRPYIAMDGGGIEVVDLVEEQSLVIAYQGNCVSCFSSVGATLSYIQQVIRAKVHPEINVVPQM